MSVPVPAVVPELTVRVAWAGNLNDTTAMTIRDHLNGQGGAHGLGDQLRAGQVADRGQDVDGVGALSAAFAHQADGPDLLRRQVDGRAAERQRRDLHTAAARPARIASGQTMPRFRASLTLVSRGCASSAPLTGGLTSGAGQGLRPDRDTRMAAGG